MGPKAVLVMVDRDLGISLSDSVRLFSVWASQVVQVGRVFLVVQVGQVYWEVGVRLVAFMVAVGSVSLQVCYLGYLGFENMLRHL